MYRLSLVILTLVTIACSTKPAPNKFSDPELIRIYEFRDRRLADSLRAYLRADNPVYRRAAALSFGSVQDSAASLDLGNLLLEDPDVEVRKSAAFALGQTGGFLAVNALIPSLESKEREVLREVLEALGKVTQKNDVSILTSFQSNDSLLREGQAWGFYQLALRGKGDSLTTSKATEFLMPSHSYQTRLAAAHYFGRSQKIEGAHFEESLVNAALHDNRPEIRMASVSGFRHFKPERALPPLREIFNSDSDFRVRVNAMRVSQNFPTPAFGEFLLDGLKDSLESVQIAAAEVIRNVAGQLPFKRKSKDFLADKSDRVKSTLYGAILKTNQERTVVNEIIKIYPTASPYFKAGLLSSLGDARPPLDRMAFEFLSKEILNASNEKVVITSATAGLVALNRAPGNQISKREFLRIYKRAIAQNDAGVIGLVCSALMNEGLQYKKEIKDLSFLVEAKAKLTLPKDIESLQPLENAIAFLGGKEKPAPLKNEFNHPINWDLVKTIHAYQWVELKTTKGTIVLRLLVEEAPGSVNNFVDLIGKKYFDGKYFHRVVPNFVIQAGCNRGDGFGSEDYSIRSEFSMRRYVTGSVGMASAGKDTEGTQWFITHSPTPHLDGKYTIFAETISGMEAVRHMEVGDRILEVRLKN